MVCLETSEWKGQFKGSETKILILRLGRHQPSLNNNRQVNQQRSKRTRSGRKRSQESSASWISTGVGDGLVSLVPRSEAGRRECTGWPPVRPGGVQEKPQNSCRGRGCPGVVIYLFILAFIILFFLSLYWICYIIASVLCFVFLDTRHVGSWLPWPGIEPAHPELEGQVLTYWTTREVPDFTVLNHSYIITETSDSKLYIPYSI